jgi:hypothetical protein
VLEKALTEIKPEEVYEGRLSDVVIEMAKVHQAAGAIALLNKTMLRGSALHYRLFEDYYNIWVRWAEMMLEEGYPQDALRIIKHILLRKRAVTQDAEEFKIRNNEELLKTHTGIWQLYIDLEMMLGNF